MALEWIGIGLVAGAEAVLLLLMTLPALQGLRKGMIHVAQSMLQPMLAGVPLALFLALDIYWKIRNMPPMQGHPGELERNSKMIFKSQRNALLVFCALFFYWLLYRVTRMLIRLEHLEQQQSAKVKKAAAE
ncbi:unnamed protein product [Calypogeia fissa]